MTTEVPRRTDDPLLAVEGGSGGLLLGNEAIVRGAIEAGVGFACGYPGTPASEIIDTFARLAPRLGIPFEYSINEKIALEMAFAASLAGARSIVSMKHLGLNYAGDPLSTIPYIGTVGGMVIVSAADPGCRTSPNEQDQRHLANMLHIPLLDPATPQEALEMSRFAFELSECSKLPVMLRPTARICHTRSKVTFGPVRAPFVGGFRREARFLPMPDMASKLRLEITERLEAANGLLAGSGFNRRKGKSQVAVLGTGVAAAICADVIQEQGLDDRLTSLRLGVLHPLPEDWLLEQLRDLETVLVVEELSPYVEDALRALCSLHGVDTKILGKRTGHLPVAGEYQPARVRSAINELLGLDTPVYAPPAIEEPAIRPPILCVACPHRSAFFAAKMAFGEDALYFNDIGCYTLGATPPLEVGDALLCMGAGLTLAAGVARTTGKKTVGFIGDSTFFHSGMPALLNAVKENVNMVAVIMDNEVTAMTGFQESPTATVVDGGIEPRADIEGVVRALGVAHVCSVDPNDLGRTTEAFSLARDYDGLSVVITKHACPVFLAKATGRSDTTSGVNTFVINHERCQHCGRDGCGHRCKQEITKGFESAMARARVLEVGEEAQRPGVAPCASKCPLYLCVQGYAAHIVAGQYEDALELIMDGLPLPDSVCRVCDRPCESACVRNLVDEPVAINDLKRHVVEWANRESRFPYERVCEKDHGRVVAVVGAGPAGLAAAHELRVRGYGVTLYDANDEPGGMLLTGIPEYRLPLEGLRRDVKRILDLGVKFEAGQRLGENLRLSELLDRNDAVFLATGSYESLPLELPGEGPAVSDALRYLGRENTENAGNVVVIGGGNSAIDAARTALRRGSKVVTIACLEARHDMPAIESEIIEAEREGVQVRTHTKPLCLHPGGIELVGVRPRIPGDSSPDTFDPIAGSEFIVEADQVILALGQKPDRRILTGDDPELRWSIDVLQVDDETCQTSNPRVFAGGDLVSTDRTVTRAIAWGLRAAWGIDRSLRDPATADKRPPAPHVGRDFAPYEGGFDRRDNGHRRRPPQLDPESRTSGFDEIEGVLSQEQARAEAARCMICGSCGNCRVCLDFFGCPAFYLDQGLIEIDPELCTACGVCAQFCPNDAIEPEYRTN